MVGCHCEISEQSNKIWARVRGQAIFYWCLNDTSWFHTRPRRARLFGLKKMKTKLLTLLTLIILAIAGAGCVTDGGRGGFGHGHGFGHGPGHYHQSWR